MQAQVVLPRKVIGRARSQGPYSAAQSGDRIPRDDNVRLNRSIRDQRQAASAATLMRALFETNGLVSTAVATYVAMAHTNPKISAYETATREFSRAGLQVAEAVMASLTAPWDYSGYTDHRCFNSVIETLLLENILTGAVAVELVLDAQRLPQDLAIIPYDSITYVSKGKGRKVPTQRNLAGGDDIVLDLPTVFIEESLKPANRKYALPLLHSGLQRLFHYEDFLETAWRVVNQAGMSRMIVSLNYDRVVASAPAEVAADPDKLAGYLEQVRAIHESLLSGLTPEEALVMYDVAEVDAIKVTGDKQDIKDLMEALAGLAASSLKSNPSMLGLRIGGSQNTSSTESMLAVKTAKLFQRPVQAVLSKALTLATRLHGVDAIVEVEFEGVDLRPLLELEPHRAIQLNRVLELLSLGRITDDEAQAMLGLTSLPLGAEILSGTGFYDKKSPDTTPVSATNSRNRQIAPQTPGSAGGADNEQRP